ncbi:MAG: sodium/proline symporter [Alphaproteobacteria bacterium]
MHIVIFAFYFLVLLLFGFYFGQKHKAEYEFTTGGRRLKFWVTALSAHASDMSTWLFMGFPAAVYLNGLSEIWTAIGLTVCMFFSWQFIAPKIRMQAAIYESFTLSSFLSKRTENSKVVLVVSSLIISLFLVFYITAGFVGLGRLFEAVFQIDYHKGLFISVFVITVYTFLGGFIAVAFNDMLQAVFLLIVIVFVPLVAYSNLHGSFDLIANLPKSTNNWFENFMLAISWGLGYLGLPHVINKFMSIDDPLNLKKAKYLGMSWQCIVLVAATYVGILGATMYPSLQNPELIFVVMTKDLFKNMFSTIALCGILAAAFSTIDSQIMTAASTMSRDLFRKTNWEIAISRISIIVICFISCIFAWSNNSSIYSLVQYAWCGLGSTFGSVLLWCLSSYYVNAYGVTSSMIITSLLAGFWPLFGIQIPAMVPCFILGLFITPVVSRLWKCLK